MKLTNRLWLVTLVELPNAVWVGGLARQRPTSSVPPKGHRSRGSRSSVGSDLKTKPGEDTGPVGDPGGEEMSGIGGGVGAA